MSALLGLGPLLDASALFNIARQVWAARERLSLRTGGNIPTMGELAVALRMYVAEKDRVRGEVALEESRVDPSSAEDAEDADGQFVMDLCHYMALADATYAASEEGVSARLVDMGGESLLESRWVAEKWHPGYFVARDVQLDCIIVAVRGSKETSDFITNLTCQTEPFMNGRGHGGVIKSARNLHNQLREKLAEYLDLYRPANGLVLVGHSLGGAVAAALTMLLRTPDADIEANTSTGRLRAPGSSAGSDTSSESVYARQIMATARCFEFSGPPFLCSELAAASRSMDITSVVLGLDLVPRLSAASLDRLLLAVSRYDWSHDVGHSVSRVVEGMATSVVGHENARSVAQVVTQHYSGGLAWASSAVEGTAQRALDTHRTQGGSGLWGAALNATVFATRMVNHQFTGGSQSTRHGARNGSLRQPEYTFASHFGLTARDVEEVLVPEQPTELYLAGRILHLDRPFMPPSNFRENAVLPPARIVERNALYFADVEASAWMVHDHHPCNIMDALASLL